jgi:DNA (cytosine-5)-methyltransferase 1
MKPRLLDLYAGAGGAARGYQQAGFHVTGIDIKPQPRYAGDEFLQADALKFLDLCLGAEIEWDYDVIHASPPCQAFTNAQVIHGREHPDLLTPTRTLLEQTGLPWVIENVPGAPMRKDLVLCGTQFDGLSSENGQLVRHRWFEFSDPSIAPSLVHPCRHDRPTVSVFGHGGHIYHGVEDWKLNMGIDWMTRDELAQAIPPAYTQFIGEQLLAHLDRVRPVPSSERRSWMEDVTAHERMTGQHEEWPLSGVRE